MFMWLIIQFVIVLFQLLPTTCFFNCSNNKFYPASYDEQSQVLTKFQAGKSVLEPTSFIEEENTLQTKTPRDIRVGRGSKMNLSCQCTAAVPIPINNKLTMEVPFGVCAANEVKIVSVSTGTGMTEDDVRMVVGNPLLVKWAKVSSHHFSDWEPRTDSPLLGTPGGDIVEFISMLDAFEHLTGARFSWWHCTGIMFELLRRTNKLTFYLATDALAMEVLGDYMGDPDLDLRPRPTYWRYWTQLFSLLRPEHNGCRILKGMLRDPGSYGIRDGLAQCAIIGFYSVLWDKSRLEGKKLRIVSLDPPTQGHAIIKLKSSEACMARGLAPLFKPKRGEFSMFVVHEDAVSLLRSELVSLMTRLHGRLDPTQFLNKMKSNGEKFLSVAMAEAAPGIPVYEVHLL